MLEKVKPIIFILSASIGFIACMLFIRNRKPEFANMRSLGTSKGLVFTEAFFEQSLFGITGTLIGIGIYFILHGSGAKFIAQDILIFIACYLAGAIVGKSGSGKTTLLSLLAGLDVPKEGAVSYMGKPTKDMDRDRYRREDVAVIYQDFNLFPLLTVIENVMYPLQLKGMNEKQAMQIASEKINAVGMDENFYKRFPSMLSGGEQQRIAIARALASGAQIILADEPTGNLDTENGNNIIGILKNLHMMTGTV
jgi:ABC-type lipoprotein export system ATPase subunit